MDKRELGRTGLMVSEVAFGGVEIGMPYANRPMPPETESVKILLEAVDHGINFFDTAREYGKSEQLMGRAFQGRRSQLVIATKSGNILDSQGHLPTHYELSRIIHSSLEKSLHALATKYVDLFMIHQGNEVTLNSDALLEIMSALKRSGKVRAIGVSTYNVKDSDLAMDREIWDVVQVPFNLLDQSHLSVFDKAKRLNIGIVARSVLLRGLLSGPTQALHPALSDVQDHIELFLATVEEEGTDLPGLAMKFALSYKEISSVLVGIDKMEYLARAVEVADGLYPDGKLLQKIETMSYPFPEFLNLNSWVRNKWLA